jgi:hypothetical protein
VSREGWVLAAEHGERAACALFFKPDSVLSLHGGAGVRALRAALARLDPHGMLNDQPGTEPA